MSAATGNPIRWRLHLPVPLPVVFQALTTAEGRAKFWAESAVETNGVIHFTFINGAAYDSQIVERMARRGPSSRSMCRG